MDSRLLFPLGKAYGKAFCNRVEDTARLAGNVKSCKHTLLIAPRRYGKSSLAERAIEQSKLPYIKVNFHLCTSEPEVAQLMVDSVIKLIGLSVGAVDKLMVSIKKYLANLEPMLAFGGELATLKLVPKSQANYSIIIAESLLLLEKLLREKNKQAVLFLDEFQEISKIEMSKSIEGAFRTAAQEMQKLAIIFSGSVRSLLLSMFEDESRPLYKLCRKIRLTRIDAEDYEKHIQNIAKNSWGSELNPEVFAKIMQLANRHPYYVNYLCDAIWETCKKLPSIADVDEAWHRVVTEEWSDALKELSDLPMGQRRLLKYIATQKGSSLQSQEASLKLAMATSSIASALNALTEKDYIEQ
ncbi:MAG: ATP-binding protein, partial [Gammaproteobacteria bacterium]|nr:ATP-binding protein [Gammaproteobacteria bacterium]